MIIAEAHSCSLNRIWIVCFQGDRWVPVEDHVIVVDVLVLSLYFISLNFDILSIRALHENCLKLANFL